jgi:transaldolase
VADDRLAALTVRPDTMYVTELVVPGTVNTMPEATLDAFADHGLLRGADNGDAMSLRPLPLESAPSPEKAS